MPMPLFRVCFLKGRSLCLGESESRVCTKVKGTDALVAVDCAAVRKYSHSLREKAAGMGGGRSYTLLSREQEKEDAT